MSGFSLGRRFGLRRGVVSGGVAPLVPSAWILANGVWNDDGVWDDAAIWKDVA